MSIQRIKQEVEGAIYSEDSFSIYPLFEKRRFLEIVDEASDKGYTLFFFNMMGEATISIDHREVKIVPNTVIFIDPARFDFIKKCRTLVAYTVLFDLKYIDKLFSNIFDSIKLKHQLEDSPICNIDAEKGAILHNQFQVVRGAINNIGAFKTEIVNSIFHSIICSIVSFYVAEGSNCSSSVRTKRADELFEELIKLIEQYSDTERSAEFYAQKLGVTSKHLSCAIKGVSGRTTTEWIDEAVIARAKSLLTDTSLSINDVATRLNFTSQAFFYKYFKQKTGTSPSRFRRQD